MKKLIGLITILLLSTSIFGQINLNDLSEIEQGEWSSKTDILHFTTEVNEYKIFYILAYEPNFFGLYEGGVERNVYLYSIVIDYPDYIKNNKDFEKLKKSARWRRASDAVLINHYYDSDNFQDVDFYTYNKDRHNTSNGSVRLDGNNVIFNLELHNRIKGCSVLIEKTVVLECKFNPTRNGYFYTVKR